MYFVFLIIFNVEVLFWHWSSKNSKKQILINWSKPATNTREIITLRTCSVCQLCRCVSNSLQFSPTNSGSGLEGTVLLCSSLGKTLVITVHPIMPFPHVCLVASFQEPFLHGQLSWADFQICHLTSIFLFRIMDLITLSSVIWCLEPVFLDLSLRFVSDVPLSSWLLLKTAGLSDAGGFPHVRCAFLTFLTDSGNTWWVNTCAVNYSLAVANLWFVDLCQSSDFSPTGGDE